MSERERVPHNQSANLLHLVLNNLLNNSSPKLLGSTGAYKYMGGRYACLTRETTRTCTSRNQIAEDEYYTIYPSLRGLWGNLLCKEASRTLQLHVQNYAYRYRYYAFFRRSIPELFGTNFDKITNLTNLFRNDFSAI